MTIIFLIGLKVCKIPFASFYDQCGFESQLRVHVVLSREGGIKQSRPEAKGKTSEIGTGTRWRIRKPENM